MSKTQKDKLDRQLLEWQEKGLFKSIFGYEANKILNRKNVSYSEMIKILIMGIYVEQNQSLDEYNNLLFLEVAQDSYNQAIDEIQPKKRSLFKLPIFYTLLNIPILNATAEEYLYALSLTNANEMYKETLISMQADIINLNINNNFFKELTNKQQNRFLSINNDVISGGIENIIEVLSNRAFVQAGIDTDTKQIRFIAHRDNRTTRMCRSLDNQIFNLEDYNRYDRYSAMDKRIVRYTTKGLIEGDNKPPINNHFHYCRSTLTYQI